jgi:capsular exopolysaccharide synthesis family protein
MFGDRNNVLIEPPAPAGPVSGLPGGGHAPGEGEVHLLDRLSVLYRYRKVVATVIVVVLIAGVVQTMTTTPEYRAYATIQVGDERSMSGLVSGDQANDSFVQMATHEQALQSKDLIRDVVTAGGLNLANRPEFNGQGTSPTGFAGAVDAIRARVLRPILGLFGRGQAPADIDTAPVDPQRALEDRLVDAFLSRMDATVQGDSRTLRVDFVSSDPVLAADAANALSREFIRQNLERRRGNLETTIEMLKAEFKAADQQIKDMDARILEFRNSPGSNAVMDRASLQSAALQLEAELTKAQAAERAATDAYQALDAIEFSDPRIDTFSAMYVDPEVRRWTEEVRQRQIALAAMTLGEDHPERIAAQTAVNTAQRELRQARTMVVERLRQDMLSAQRNRSVAEVNLGKVRELQNAAGASGIDLDSLIRVRENSTDQLKDLQTNLQDYQLDFNNVQNNLWLLESAVAPNFPFKPDVSSNMLIALFVGFALAGALAFGLDYLDDTIKTPEDITRKLRIPFLGLVPSVRGDKQPVLSGPVPHDFGEAYRALRTSLVFTSGGESTRIITCTSAQPLEGKTTTACNLAMVLAFGGSRVLLIDADMRRPGVHKALKINNTVGLSHLLVGQARVREAIQRTSDPNFCVMTAGRTPPNPSELLSSERMKQLVANLKQGPFDWVVIDTPPVLAVTDAVILTPLVDGVTFVLGAEMTRRRLAERAVQMLMVSRPKVVGAVLNRVNFDRNKYYYSRYYGYQYKSYYGSSGSTAKV